MGALEIEVMLLDFCGKHLYQSSHLDSPGMVTFKEGLCSAK